MNIELEKECIEYYKNIFKNIPENIKKIKIDIGASHNAPHSKNWIKNSKDVFVFAFEPLEESRDIFQKYLEEHNESERVKLIPYALDDIETTKVKFYLTSGYRGCSSLLRPRESLFRAIKKGVEEKEVICTNLKLFFCFFPWEKFDYIEYIKVDVQGKDLEVIKSAGDYLKEKVVYVTLEPETIHYENCKDNNMKNMISYMKNMNFIYINHKNTRDPTFINKKFIHLKEKIYIYQKT